MFFFLNFSLSFFFSYFETTTNFISNTLRGNVTSYYLNNFSSFRLKFKLANDFGRLESLVNFRRVTLIRRLAKVQPAKRLRIWGIQNGRMFPVICFRLLVSNMYVTENWRKKVFLNFKSKVVG